MIPNNEVAANLFVVLVTLVLFVVTGSVVWFLARLLRWKWPRLSLPVSLVVSHTALLVFCVTLCPTGIFFMDRPFDDLYLGFYLFPGMYLYVVAGQILYPFQSLFLRLPGFWGAVLYLLIFPAILCIILGGAQWYLIGKVVEKIRAVRARRIPHHA
jgi:hypothetical protein